MPFTPCSICTSRESLLKPLKAQCSFQVWKFVNIACPVGPADGTGVNDVPYFIKHPETKKVNEIFKDVPLHLIRVATSPII